MATRLTKNTVAEVRAMRREAAYGKPRRMHGPADTAGPSPFEGR
ncbi:hypothetical protein GA0061098_10072 [Bradyrhizobium shewense]|uniref:Uncharacterized protein n=1 Tax=Bradyrhizobium shewense TaxID=1761772 RepID=A0A1C3W909_9BRAD|nr:hypothetical protein GA0061098_10072 [Bradyrhizobium shewense]